MLRRTDSADLLPSRHIAEVIRCPADEVYAFASDPANLPSWAAGLSTGIESVDGRWGADSPMGRAVVTMAPWNEFGVLDHAVELPDGRTFLNPLRVLPLGTDSEIVFTLRTPPGMSIEDMEADAASVTVDLLTLKRLLETAAA